MLEIPNCFIFPMPELNAPPSIFNISNRGLNASLATARDTFNQLLTNFNWGMPYYAGSSGSDPLKAIIQGNYGVLKELAREVGGEALAMEVDLPNFDPAGWRIQGIKDYDGDRDVDIFWKDTRSGQVAFWQLNNWKFEKGVMAPSFDYNSWNVKGFEDFDRDGDQDMLWHSNSGDVGVWEMNGMSFKAGSFLWTVGYNWYFSGIGNFNGDGASEILWRNSNGQVATWEIKDFGISKVSHLPINIGGIEQVYTAEGTVDSGWSVRAVVDLDNDGDTDIIWGDLRTGEMAIWEMQGGQIKAGNFLPKAHSFTPKSPTSSYVRHYGYWDSPVQYGGQFDIDGDGFVDIWWQSANGQREAWSIKGLKYAATLKQDGNRY